MGFSVEVARLADVNEMVALESALFREDAGVREPSVDLSWPERAGHADLERLIRDPSSVVLKGCDGARVVGMLAGYRAAPSPTRPQATSACLRTLYVCPSHRRIGVATALVDRFLQWAGDHGCTDAFVDSYAANHDAGRLYERLGFRPLSVRRVYELP